MEHQVKAAHGFIVNVADNGAETDRICGEIRGWVKVRDLEVQMIESIEWGTKIKVSLKRKGQGQSERDLERSQT